MAFEGLFFDSAYAIALVSTADQHHDAAAEFAASLKANPTRLVTTRAVLLEIGNALAKPQFRPVAIAMLQGFENDPGMEIIPVGDALYERGFELFRSRLDKAWSLTDCISFVVMNELALTQALTSDMHFEQAGYTALLRK